MTPKKIAGPTTIMRESSWGGMATRGSKVESPLNLQASTSALSCLTLLHTAKTRRLAFRVTRPSEHPSQRAFKDKGRIGGQPNARKDEAKSLTRIASQVRNGSCCTLGIRYPK